MLTFNEEPPLERVPPALTRAASVREPSSTNSHPPHTAASGAIGTRNHDFVSQNTQQKAPVDEKRRTVQVEYVKPLSWTTRGDPNQQGPVNQEGEEADAAPAPVVSTGKHYDSLARAATTAGIVSGPARTSSMDPKGKEREILQVGESKGPRNRPTSYAFHPGTTSRAPGSGDGTASKTPSRRPSRDKNCPPVSGKVLGEPGSTSTRPNTANSLGGSNRMPSRGGSYSRPVAPSVAANSNNAQGKIAMPKGGKPYTISHPIPQPDNSEAIGSSEMGKPVTTAQSVKHTSRPLTQPEQPPKGHRRANTVGGGAGGEAGRIIGKIMGNSDKHESPLRPIMTGAAEARQSLDQGGRSKYERTSASKSRRFSSLLPTSFSLRNIPGSGHARRPSRSTSRLSEGRFVTPESQTQASSQPQLGASHAGGGSVLTNSDISLGIESAPASAAGGGPGRDSIEVSSGRRPTVLQKNNNRKFTEGEVNGTGGSSGPARRVMDFFRRRGVVRSKGEV